MRRVIPKPRKGSIVRRWKLKKGDDMTATAKVYYDVDLTKSEVEAEVETTGDCHRIDCENCFYGQNGPCERN